MDKYLKRKSCDSKSDQSDTENNVPSGSKKMYQQKLRGNWLHDKRFSEWVLRVDDLTVKCKYCFTTMMAKLSVLQKHCDSQKHKKNILPVLEKKQKKIEFTSNSNVAHKKAELSQAIYVAVHTSFRTIDHLVSVQKNVFDDSACVTAMKLGRTKCSEVINMVLGPYFQTILLEDLQESKFSLIIDEATDLSVEKLLGVVVRFYSKKLQKIVTTFLKLIAIDDATASGITSAILNLLEDCNLKIENMVGLGTDNANVMTGINNGVISKLKEKNESIILVPCICHSIQLSVSHASKTLPHEIEYLISETYNWFSKSSSRQLHYKNIYSAINNDSKPLKIVRSCATRWLSIETAVNRIEHQFIELKMHFEIAAIRESCHQAKILKNLYNDTNLAYLKFLKPLLVDVQKINKMFESNNADTTYLFAELRTLIQDLVYQIVLRSDDFDPFNSNLKDFFCPIPYFNYSFEQFLKTTALDSESKLTIRFNCRNFIYDLVNQLKNRLPENFNTMQKINFFSCENSLKQKKTKLYEHFKEDIKCFSEDTITVIEMQWQKLALYSWNATTTVEFWVEVFEYKNAVNDRPFKELALFVLNKLILPLSNAEVERVFSYMNFFKTKLRNRMLCKTVNSLLHIRCGLKLLKNCCHNFEITEKLLKMYEKYKAESNKDPAIEFSDESDSDLSDVM